MFPVLYEMGGVLLSGAYLLGQYQWSEDATLTEAVLVCQPPVNGTLTLALEVGGVLSGDVFEVAAGVDEFRQTLALDVSVPVGSVVRWKVFNFDGTPEDAATKASITLQAT